MKYSSFRHVVSLFVCIVSIDLLALNRCEAEVVFGATLTLTGSGGRIGSNAREGMDLAKEEVNAAGGISGQPLRLIYEDIGELDLKKAASAAQKFIAVDRVTALLPMVTEDAEVMWPIAHRANVVTMAVYAGGRELTRNRHLLFQVSSSDEIFGRTLTDYALRRGSQTACLVVAESAYSISIGDATAQYWKQKTGHDAKVYQYASPIGDARAILLKMRSDRCDAVFLLTMMVDQGTFLKQLAAMNWHPLRLGLDTSEDPGIVESASAATDGVVFVKYLIATPEFADKFQKRFGHPPGVPAALAYDAVKILSGVLSTVGHKRDLVRDEILMIRDYPGASGPLSIDEDGTRHERIPTLWRFDGAVAKPLVESRL